MALAERSWLVEAPDQANQIKLLQWNCLADWAAYPEAFPKVPPGILPWSYRKPLVIEECLRIDPDIVCLQEVDHFDQLLEAFGKNFSGEYFPKGANPSSTKKDGAAIFWRNAKFEIRESKRYHYSELCDQPEMGQIVGAARFELKSKPGTFVQVATTHLKARAEFENVRQQQVIGLTKLMAELDQKENSLTIVCGDFNTTVESSAIQRMNEAGFLSAYRSLRKLHRGLDSEPDWTTWKIREQTKKQTIDFVFFQADKRWHLTDVWCMPDENQFDAEFALPCSSYPSDHCALAAKFDLKA